MGRVCQPRGCEDEGQQEIINRRGAGLLGIHDVSNEKKLFFLNQQHISQYFKLSISSDKIDS